MRGKETCLRLFTLISGLLVLSLILLAGCGGGGDGSTTTPSINGTFTTQTTRTAGDKLYVALQSSGTTVTGNAEILPVSGAAAIVAPLTNAQITSAGVLSFTASLNGTPYVFSGTRNGTTIVGTLTIGNNPADSSTLTKVSDTLAAPIAGTWQAVFAWTTGPFAGQSQTVTIVITQPSGGNTYSGISASGNTTVSGTVFGNVIQWVIVSSVGNAIGVGSVNSGTSMSGPFISTTSTSDSAGTITWTKTNS